MSLFSRTSSIRCSISGSATMFKTDSGSFSRLAFRATDEIPNYCMLSGIDGMWPGTRPLARRTVRESGESGVGNGGLSGARFSGNSGTGEAYSPHQGRLPIVGCGGSDPEQAQEMLDAGASLLEIYTGFIYEGPALVRKTSGSRQRKKNEHSRTELHDASFHMHDR